MMWGDNFVDAKLLCREGNEHFKVGACGMNGRRFNMEDAHKCILSMQSHPQTAYFSLFDGHGGNSAANWAAENLDQYLDQVAEINNPNAIAGAVLRADHNLRQTLERGDDSGTTAIFVLASPQDPDSENEETEQDEMMWNITVGYVGDSRVLLLREDEEMEVLTMDHKPSLPKEFTRIRNAGGYVSGDRVDGDLAVSRALGDFSFKKNLDLSPTEQKVISIPGICFVNEVKEGDIILLMCDGIYETLSNEEIANFIRREVKDEDNEGDLALIAAKLCDKAGEDGTDNTSAVIVQFTNGREYNMKDEFVPASDVHLFEAQDRGRWSFQCWLEMYQRFAVDYCNQDWNQVMAVHKLQV
eukprot:TRINITY_DN839_c0_g1_i1.p1 TRINITY_DN839_c0_g1~~TRINITY_DN839_c0_g1_i1.p1  ORF type:complete len:356 (+),score=89.37 TRINITY_DN839_c0_g1_i1:111-1178(+)